LIFSEQTQRRAGCARDADQNTKLFYDFSDDVKTRLIAIAREFNLSADDICQTFIEWKLGKPADKKSR
jgi:hypothetical protein